MDKYTLLLMIVATSLLLMCVCTGCNRGDMKVTPVIQGESAPHRGYVIGPSLWVETGVPVPITGAVVWVQGTDPNDIFE
jgi:hypothetical protein